MSVSEELLGDLEYESEYITVLAKGGELLARREHSVAELSRKLRHRRFAQPAIDRVLAKLKESGFLDDRRFADGWVRSRLRRHPEGFARLAAGLRMRGVDRVTIDEVLELEYTEEQAEDAVSRAAEKFLRRGNIDREALHRKLKSRGFTYRQVQAYLQNIK